MFLQSPVKEPCQTSQTSLEGDPSSTTSTPTTPSPTTLIPVPRKGTGELSALTDEHAGPVKVAPIPLPRQSLPQQDQVEVNNQLPSEVLQKDVLSNGGLPNEVLLESEKSESEGSTKTSSSDSGIEDGKSTPTSQEEKVGFVNSLSSYVITRSNEPLS